MNPTTPHASGPRPTERGSVLVICMIMASLGTLGVAAWISLMDARGHQMESNLTALKRKVVRGNSRALAHRALYANHLHAAEPLASDTTYELPDGLGRATVRAFNPAPLAAAASLRFTKTGATPVQSYTTDVAVILHDGEGSHDYQYQLRSGHPVLGGELLSFHPPVDHDSASPLVSGNLRVEGRAAFRDAAHRDFGAGVRAEEFLLPEEIGEPASFATPAGDSTLPLNYPLLRQTTGFADGAPAYRGELDVVEESTNRHNTYVERIRNSGDFLEFDGQEPHADGTGPDTIPPGPGGTDAAMKQRIDQVAASGSGQTGLYNQLSNFPHLSSEVMMHAIETPEAFHPGDLHGLLESRAELPDDVLAAVAEQGNDGLTPSEKEQLLRRHGVSAWSDGGGGVTVYLDDPALPHLIARNVEELYLLGPSDDASADALAEEPPVAIAVVNPSAVTSSEVQLDEQNRRRLAVAISSGAPSGASPAMRFTGSTPFPVWNLVLDLENTGAAFDVAPVSSARIVGGIRANRSISVTGGSLSLEQLPRGVDYGGLLPRNAWIEAFHQ